MVIVVFTVATECDKKTEARLRGGFGWIVPIGRL